MGLCFAKFKISIRIYIMKKIKFFTFVIVSLILKSTIGLADVQLLNIRKMAVFPIANINTSNSEEAWWQIRESLTRDQRFFVASRRFMVNRGVFQPRTQLKTSDVIILGKILESECIYISYIKERNLHAIAYDSENGFKLWEGEYNFHSVIPVNDQVVAASQKLAEQFLSTFPYQSFQVVSEDSKNIQTENDNNYAFVFSPANSDVKVGDEVQWISVEADPSFPLFTQGLKVNILAKGSVVEVKDRQAKVQIEALKSPQDFKDSAIIRIPRLESLWKEQFQDSDEKSAKLSYEYLASELSPNKSIKPNTHNPTSTALSWLFSMAGFILLAF